MRQTAVLYVSDHLLHCEIIRDSVHSKIMECRRWETWGVGGWSAWRLRVNIITFRDIYEVSFSVIWCLRDM